MQLHFLELYVSAIAISCSLSSWKASTFQALAESNLTEAEKNKEDLNLSGQLILSPITQINYGSIKGKFAHWASKIFKENLTNWKWGTIMSDWKIGTSATNVSSSLNQSPLQWYHLKELPNLFQSCALTISSTCRKPTQSHSLPLISVRLSNQIRNTIFSWFTRKIGASHVWDAMWISADFHSPNSMMSLDGLMLGSLSLKHLSNHSFE